MNAIIKLDVPDFQIGQKVSVYFQDTMTKQGVVEKEKTGYWKLWGETVKCFAFTIGDYEETVQHCECSECGTEIIPEESMCFKFCPFCGIKIEGDKDETVC